MLESVSTFFHLEVTVDGLQCVQNQPLSWTTILAPQKNKWKLKNQEKIEIISPRVSPLMSKLNYVC